MITIHDDTFEKAARAIVMANGGTAPITNGVSVMDLARAAVIAAADDIIRDYVKGDQA